MDLRAALLDQTQAFGELVRGADPLTPIPTCPDWTLKQLFRHVGRGTRWAAQIISERRNEPVNPREVRNGKPPDDLDAAIDWLNAGPHAVITAIDQVGSDARVWTAAGMRPAGWWIRRLLHEVAVHRADAALALGADYDVSPDLAADAISEWIELMVLQATRQTTPPLERGRTLHLHATDAGLGPTGEWTIAHDDGGLSWTHDHGKGDVALRGPAKDLLLAVVRRRPVTELDIEVFGDSDVWDGWLERTPF
ncbi:maleylpyruvate isomerase family mycothiol-dependent enzyme [Mycobacterium barrassiae]|uniref:maleylpyruvate isomerase family mycothiol-dependent enzyme n=1 Tax=Mycobacterium barrassiae TaxID=319709 RepID=UPI002265A4DB|nr:maleylpyruvate isomerase family mycothiol-dependent enzyme [Mycobacterium barrassiae]MCV7302312.1 maleylpyruvate isomerase family mycothiol-dependent enzyme [Mycobacterium barrassiae]